MEFIYFGTLVVVVVGAISSLHCIYYENTLFLKIGLKSTVPK